MRPALRASSRAAGAAVVAAARGGAPRITSAGAGAVGARALRTTAPGAPIAADPLLVSLLRHGTSADQMWGTTKELLAGVLGGDRASLAKAITLIESLRDDHRAQAELLLDALLQARSGVQFGGGVAPGMDDAAVGGGDDGGQLDAATRRELRRRAKLGLANAPPGAAARSGGDGSDAGCSAAAPGAGHPHHVHSHTAAAPSPAVGEVELDDTGHPFTVVPHDPAAIPPTFRIGIAGPPGAGKSTLIEALGMHAIGKGHRVAVVAVDPSSSRYGGSILGDKTRMPELARHPDAYVRPSPTRGALGGLAEHTNDVILLCEGGGYDVVLVETVGLGQSEVAIDSAVDMLLLVVPPAGGDELQGVKKGIMEVADAVVVNKSDPGSPLANAGAHSQAEYRRALQLMRWKHEHPAGVWVPPVARCAALTGWGVPDVWDACARFRHRVGGAGVISARRRTQASEWMWAGLASQLTAAARGCAAVTATAGGLTPALAAGALTPRRAAHELLARFMAASGAAVDAVAADGSGGGGREGGSSGRPSSPPSS
jgi:LAO/AO transport system kinase